MRFVITWVMLAALWFGLSGFTDAVHLAFGAVSVTLVTAISSGHLLGEDPVGPALARMLRLVLYLPWLLWQVALANVDVLLRVLGLRPLAPRVIRFRPGLETDFGRTTLANSITLTPGTVTVDVEADGTFVVHAISPEAADAVLKGVMTEKVRRVEGGR